MTGLAFDLEGTCVDLEELHFKAYERALSEFGVVMASEDIAKIPGAIGGGGPVVFSQLSPHNPGLKESLLREKKSLHFQKLFQEALIRPRVGLISYIERALSRGMPISIGSVTSRLLGEEILRRSGLAPYFAPEACIFREDVSSLKPAPHVYLKTAEAMLLEVAEQIVFEDSSTGVAAAVAAGSTAVAVPSPLVRTPERISELMTAGAESLYFEWTEVPLPSA